MSNTRKDQRAAEMQALYDEGNSLAQIAQAFGVTRQSVYKMLKVTRGARLRTRAALPFVEWQGKHYSLRESGYYARTTDARQYLHRDVWEHHNGPIPEGHDVHHRDEDKANNAIGNLACLDALDHAHLHGFGGNQHTGSLGRRPIR